MAPREDSGVTKHTKMRQMDLRLKDTGRLNLGDGMVLYVISTRMDLGISKLNSKRKSGRNINGGTPTVMMQMASSVNISPRYVHISKRNVCAWKGYNSMISTLSVFVGYSPR